MVVFTNNYLLVQIGKGSAYGVTECQQKPCYYKITALHARQRIFAIDSIFHIQAANTGNCNK